MEVLLQGVRLLENSIADPASQAAQKAMEELAQEVFQRLRNIQPNLDPEVPPTQGPPIPCAIGHYIIYTTTINAGPASARGS